VKVRFAAGALGAQLIVSGWIGSIRLVLVDEADETEEAEA